MKFAKQLQEQQLSEWSPDYIDYKNLKKALRVIDDSCAASQFCSLLQAQVTKVSTFIRIQQGSIRDDLSPLVTSSEIARCEVYQSAQGRSEQLVGNIERLRNYVVLNQTGIRKIIKKFDKTFKIRFYDEIYPAPEMACTVGQIDAWMLSPARECMRLLSSHLSGPSRPMRQFSFWVEELRFGCAQLEQLRQGAAITSLRLRMFEKRPEEVRLIIKNTFIHANDDGEEEEEVPEEAPARPRLRSTCEPGSWRRYASCVCPEQRPQEESSACGEEKDLHEELSSTPIILLEHMICDTLGMAPVPRCWEAHSDDEDIPISYSTKPAVPPGKFLSDVSGPSASRPPRRRKLLTPQDPEDSAGSHRCAEEDSREKWWKSTQEVCKLSGFPIAMLPYPPFKFRGDLDSPKVLIDGQFLILQVISKWQFEALGRALTIGDINALDKHMKQCKLGPWRLGKAMKLLSDNTPESHCELAMLRARARQRLGALHHIQRSRLHLQQPGPSASRPQPKRKQCPTAIGLRGAHSAM